MRWVPLCALLGFRPVHAWALVTSTRGRPRGRAGGLADGRKGGSAALRRRGSTPVSAHGFDAVVAAASSLQASGIKVANAMDTNDSLRPLWVPAVLATGLLIGSGNPRTCTRLRLGLRC